MTVDCVFRKYIFTDPRTGYTVLRSKIIDGGYIIGTSNHCLVPPNLTEGCVLRLEGELGKTREAYFPYYAEPGFSFTNIEVILPPDTAHTANYIAGMGVKGIGQCYAERIAKITGNDLKAYFTQHPDPKELVQLIKQPFFKEEAVAALIHKINSSESVKALYDFLQPCGLTYMQVYRLYSTVVNNGEDLTLEQLKKKLIPAPIDEPCRRTIYDYCEESGIPFYDADMVGRMLGYTAYNATRRRYLVKTVIDNISAHGHTWSSIEDIYKSTKYIEAQSAFPEIVISKYAIYATIRNDSNQYVVEEYGERIYPIEKWKNEKAIAYHIKRLQTSHRPLPFNASVISDIEKSRGIEFSSTQKQCFDFLRTTGVKIVTGNAGTGKTTVISNLLHVYTEMCKNKQVALCAPTGRAAQRLTELCTDYGSTVKASTIHKLLNMKPRDNELTVEFNESNPLPADFLIVDEMSMVDTDLFAMLLAAVKPGALVILCGDVDQLPSVSAGKVFNDIIESKKINCIRLDVNYRQGEGNLLVENAFKINTGDETLTPGCDFEIISCDSEPELQTWAMSIAKAEKNCTILSTVHRGYAGVENMNRILQPILNRNCSNGITFNGVTFYLNDRVLMKRNNYDIGYVNGDIGIVTGISAEGININFGQETKLIPKEFFTDISLAYCMTIHKSQGSEYDTVVIILPTTSPRMLMRNLLYTAVTRARKKVYIVEQKGAIHTAIENRTTNERRTTLIERLQNS